MRNRPDRRISELCVALLLGAISFQLMSCGRSSAGALGAVRRGNFRRFQADRLPRAPP